MSTKGLQGLSDRTGSPHPRFRRRFNLGKLGRERLVYRSPVSSQHCTIEAAPGRAWPEAEGRASWRPERHRARKPGVRDFVMMVVAGLVLVAFLASVISATLATT